MTEKMVDKIKYALVGETHEDDYDTLNREIDKIIDTLQDPNLEDYESLRENELLMKVFTEQT